MKNDLTHTISRTRLEDSYNEVMRLLKEEEKFIEKMYGLQRYYLNNEQTPLFRRKENFEALEEFLLASLSELSISFQGTLDTYLDLSDIPDDHQEEI